MGINPTQPNHKAFTFDGTSSRDYGVYITGEAVFNAPQRDVQMVDIPGRNGAYALDKGNFNNITVKYPASIVADNEIDFAEAVSDLRNFLCSKTGYCRLEDEYNPDEYRMAIYKSGLEVSHDMLTAGEFDITFECKPQRWLKSGETAVTLTSGNDITNPTLFPSRPQLQVYGYGDIDLGGQEISVDNAVYGETLLANSKSISGGTVLLQNMDVMNNGDTFTVSGAVIELSYNPAKNYRVTVKDIGTGTNCTAVNGYSDQIRITPIDKTFAKGTSDSLSFSVTANVNVKPIASSSSVTTASTYSGTISYDGDSTLLFAVTPSPSTITNVKAINTNYKTPDIFGNSTKSILGNPLYIDLDIGDCWNEDSGVPVSVNNAVSLPAELPTLPSGDTTITFDNTFTKVDIVPRWWKV